VKISASTFPEGLYSSVVCALSELIVKPMIEMIVSRDLLILINFVLK
jgi:hypothetical protein